MTTVPPSCADCLEIWEPQPPGTLRGLPRPLMALLYVCKVQSCDILKVQNALVKSVCCIRVLHLKAFTLTEAYHGACYRKF